MIWGAIVWVALTAYGMPSGQAIIWGVVAWIIMDDDDPPPRRRGVWVRR